MKLPALIFDFGNVVAHFDYRPAAAKLGTRIGVSGEELLERLRPLGFSDLLKSYESGKITAQTFSKGVSERAGLELEHEEFAAAWADIFWANESIVPLLKFLNEQGYTLVLGSNTNDLHAGQFRTQFATTLALFDQLVLSYEVGHIKPSREFYLACAQAAGANPGDCVFIDDLLENVEGARCAGLEGVLFESTEGLVRDLEALGVSVPAQT
jgi:glucose-1-phosphatase